MYDIFNFGYQFWFLGPIIIIFTQPMLCNIILVIIIIFIYIEGSMNIFILYIDIIRPMSRFGWINFKASIVIKVINFNGI
jgi:hypothetical protein